MAGHRVEVGDTGTTFGEREVSTATMSAFIVAFLADSSSSMSAR
jgi:hypothetical protein